MLTLRAPDAESECSWDLRMGGLVLLVDGGDVCTSKQMAVHTVGPGDVVKLSRIMEELAGVIGDKVSIHHWSKL